MKQFIKNNVDTQLDNLCFGSFNVMDDVELEIKVLTNGVVGKAWDKPTFQLIGMKTDKNAVHQTEGFEVVSLNECIVKVSLLQQFTTKEGLLKMQLIIKDEGRVSTCVFPLIVGKTLEGEVIESIRQVAVLDDLDQIVSNLKEFEGNIDELSAKTIAANKTINADEAKRCNNEFKRNSSENARVANEDIRQTNENMRVALYESASTAEEERVANEEVRIVNENNRKIAEQTRIANENSRVIAEQNRNDIFEQNESIRNEQENKRIANENKRINEFNSLMQEETIRIASENNRLIQEIERSNAEEQRINAEAIRQAQEAKREQTYTRFDEKEIERQTAENNRKTAEEQRITAELVREQNYIKAEENRNKTYEDNESQRNADFHDAELIRQNTYQTAEDDRYTTYNNAELVRNQNEEIRKNNEIKRQNTEAKRVENETLRIQKEETRDQKVQEFLVRGEETVANVEAATEEFLARGENVIADIENRTAEALEILENSAEEVKDMRIDYMGNEHGSMRKAAISNVDYAVKTAIGELNYLDYEGQHITTTNSFEGHVKSAILYGSTKYKDVDTDEILETFEEGRNLELVSVKMPVLTTTGKNLYPYGDLTMNNPTTNVWYYTNGKPSRFGSACKRTDGGNWFYLEKGVYKYQSISENVQTNIALVGEGEKIYGSGKEIPSGWYVFRFKTKSESVDYVKISQIQLEKGSTTTPYEPYKSNILTVNEPVELREIGEVKDELNLVTGELTARIGEVVLDGSEVWSAWRENDNSYGFALRNYKIDFKPSSIPLCNRLVGANYSYMYDGIISKGIALYTGNSTTGYSIFIRLPKTECTGLEDFKTKLQANPLTVQYELAIPIIKTVVLSDNVVYSYDEVTHYDCSSEEGSLIPTAALTVPTNVNAVISNQHTTIQEQTEQINTLEEENALLIEQNEMQDVEIALNQEAINFMLFEAMGMSTLNENGGNPMAAYFANQIIKRKLNYTQVVNKYPQFKEDIDLILIAEGYGDLIVE